MAAITKLEIENYRGFFDKQTIEFAEPKGQPGSGLTIITGPNNSGKTTIVETLLMAYNKNHKQDWQNMIDTQARRLNSNFTLKLKNRV